MDFASRVFGRYLILDKLGKGGMADVYLARDDFRRQFALKVIERSDDSGVIESIAAERAGVELQTQLSLVDARVNRVVESGDLDRFFFIALEYLEGVDLHRLIRRGSINPIQAAFVASEICDTLHNAHGRGIVHGDIKPKNIRISRSGGQNRVYVLDFGIAKALPSSQGFARNEFGSVPYADPARLETGDVRPASDLWSLAATLYAMVTGRTPYECDSTDRMERMIRSRIQCPPPEPCPGELQRIITKALDPDENFRYQTAVDFRRDLMGFIESAEDAEMQLTSFELADFISGTASDFYSCFISYSTADQELANLLHKDLTAMGVRCWFAPHAVKAGRKLHEQIEEAIRVYDRLLLILSNSSMTSEWVATEIADARRKELREGRHMLFPISVVPFEQIRQWRCFDADAGKDTAREIREYYIPDFSNWRDPNVYSEAFHRLLRDLMAARNR